MSLDIKQVYAIVDFGGCMGFSEGLLVLTCFIVLIYFYFCV